MVNEIVLDYLRKYLEDYDIRDLRAKILSAGYSKEEFEAAYKAYKQEEREGLPPITLKKGFGKLKKVDNGKDHEDFSKGKDWIKISGIIGMVFFGFCIVFLLISLFFNPFRFILFDIFGNSSLSYFFIGIIAVFSLILLTLLIIFFIGFILIGDHYEIIMLKFFSWASIIVLILFFVTFNILVISSILLNPDQGVRESVVGSFSVLTGLNPELSNEDLMTLTEVPFPIYLSPAPVYLKIIYGIFISMLVTLLFVQIFFSLGLIKTESHVYSSKVSGIFNLVLTGLFILLVGPALVRLFLGPEFIFQMIRSLLEIEGVFKITQITLNALIASTLFFMSYTLLNASKKISKK